MNDFGDAIMVAIGIRHIVCSFFAGLCSVGHGTADAGFPDHRKIILGVSGCDRILHREIE